VTVLEFVTGQLLAQKLIVRLVVVKRTNRIITVFQAWASARRARSYWSLRTDQIDQCRPGDSGGRPEAHQSAAFPGVR